MGVLLGEGDGVEEAVRDAVGVGVGVSVGVPVAVGVGVAVTVAVAVGAECIRSIVCRIVPRGLHNDVVDIADQVP